MKLLNLLIGGLAALWLTCASAQTTQAPPDWARLTAEQRCRCVL